MKLSDLLTRILGLENRVQSLEQKRPDINQGLFEAMVPQQQSAKKRHDPTEPPEWWGHRLRG